MGCNGGYLPEAFDHLEKVGTTSYQCLPYSSDDGVVGECTNVCSVDPDLPFIRYKCKPDSSQAYYGRLEIANAIRKGGPVVGAL